MKKTLVIIIILVVLILAGYLTYRYFFYTCCPEPVSVVDEEALSRLRASCQSEGGFFSEALEFCQLPASDAGKACGDSDECEGFCETDLSPKEISEIAGGNQVEKSGTCGQLKNFASGCFYTVEDGRVDKMCAD